MNKSGTKINKDVAYTIEHWCVMAQIFCREFKRELFDLWADYSPQGKKVFNYYKVFEAVDENGIVIGVLLMHGLEIDFIAIDENYRKQGIGTELLETAFDSLNVVSSSSKVECSVRTENIASLNMFIKNGFSIEHLSKDAYGEGKDGFRLSRTIKQENE